MKFFQNYWNGINRSLWSQLTEEARHRKTWEASRALCGGQLILIVKELEAATKSGEMEICKERFRQIYEALKF